MDIKGTSRRSLLTPKEEQLLGRLTFLLRSGGGREGAEGLAQALTADDGIALRSISEALDEGRLGFTWPRVEWGGDAWQLIGFSVAVSGMFEASKLATQGRGLPGELVEKWRHGIQGFADAIERGDFAAALAAYTSSGIEYPPRLIGGF